MHLTAMRKVALLEKLMERHWECSWADQMAMQKVCWWDWLMEINLDCLWAFVMASKRVLPSALQKEMSSECPSADETEKQKVAQMERNWERSSADLTEMD